MRLITGTIGDESPDAIVTGIADVAEDRGLVIQAIDARYVACREQLERAVDFARRAFDRRTNVANHLGMEILLYAAGRRQIDRALTMGITEDTDAVVLVVLEDSTTEIDLENLEAALEPWVTAEDWAPGDRRETDVIDALFELSDRELAATDAGRCELVCERVALLEVEK